MWTTYIFSSWYQSTPYLYSFGYFFLFLLKININLSVMVFEFDKTAQHKTVYSKLFIDRANFGFNETPVKSIKEFLIFIKGVSFVFLPSLFFIYF